MGLNDEVDQDYKPLPDIEGDNKVETTFVPLNQGISSDNNVTANDMFKGPVVPNEVPNFNSVFLLEEERSNKVSDLLTLKLDIQRSNAVSVEDARSLDAITPGFINETNPEGFFTQEPSQTQLSETLNSIDAALDRQYQESKAAALEFVTNYVDQFTNYFEEVEMIYFQNLTNLHKAIAQLLYINKAKELEEVKFRFTRTMSWYDFLNHDIENVIDGACFRVTNTADSQDGELLTKFKDNIREVLNKTQVRSNMVRIFKQQPTILINQQAYVFDESGLTPTQDKDESDYTSVTVGSLINILASPYFQERTHQLLSILMHYKDSIADSKQQIEEIDSNTEQNIKIKLKGIASIMGANQVNYQITTGVLSHLHMCFATVTVLANIVNTMKEHTTPAK